VAAHPDRVATRTTMVAVRLTGTGFSTGRVPHPDARFAGRCRRRAL